MTFLSYLGWPVAIVVAWILAYVFVFQPMLTRVHEAMGTVNDLKQPGLTFWQKVSLYIEGSRTLIASFLLSMFAMGKAFLDVLASNTNLLDTIKTQMPWSTFVTPDMALKVVGFMMLVITFLHLYGKLRAASTVPNI